MKPSSSTSRPSFDSGFSTRSLSEVYSAKSTVAAMLEFEEALALALGEAGVAPAQEAEDAAAACRADITDPEDILDSTWEAGTPIVALREAVSAGKWFHFGATTQDAIDTAQMIQAKAALALLDDVLSSIAHRLLDLTEEHRQSGQMGRTFLQDARPTTFGFRTAMWLDAVLTHLIDLRDQRSRLAVQLGGPVGTRQSYGESGERVIASLARRLELTVPRISWHTDRSNVLSLAQAVERMARTMSRIGSDIALLASSTIGEVSVRSGGSSSMPEKENPLDSIRAVAAAAACTGAMTMMTSAPPQELDRGIGGWHAEWLALPLIFCTAGAAAEAIDVCLQSLEVKLDVMSARAEHVDLAGSMEQIEAVMESGRRLFASGGGGQ